MNPPTLYYDPTSEPCRAVLWLCIEANLPHALEYTYLTKNQHLSESFLKVNPMHQVPALQHGEFCIAEASAIMQYLAEFNDCGDVWFGEGVERRATVAKLLSWYHMNLRKILTLDYFLPALLLPVYLGVPKPAESEILSCKQALREMLSQPQGIP